MKFSEMRRRAREKLFRVDTQKFARVLVRRTRLVVLLAMFGAGGCATLQQVAALRRVDFALDRVSGARLAGIDLSRVRSYQSLSAAQIAALGLAIARDELPLEFELHIRAENPADNGVSARLLRMDWTLLLEDRETISGVLDRSFVLPPGEPQDIPLQLRVNVLEFFDAGAEDILELALAVAGVGGEPKRVALRATPTIDTPIGPIRYPQPITIVSQTVGTN